MLSAEIIIQYLYMLYINGDTLPLNELLRYTQPLDTTMQEANRYSINVINQLKEEGYLQIVTDSERNTEPIVELTSTGTLWLERRILR